MYLLSRFHPKKKKSEHKIIERERHQNLSPARFSQLVHDAVGGKPSRILDINSVITSMALTVLRNSARHLNFECSESLGLSVFPRSSDSSL